MTKLVAALLAFALLAGCHGETTVEDNSPDARERTKAMEICLGVPSYKIRDQPSDQRLLCVQAVYGARHP